MTPGIIANCIWRYKRTRARMIWKGPLKNQTIFNAIKKAFEDVWLTRPDDMNVSHQVTETWSINRHLEWTVWTIDCISREEEVMFTRLTISPVVVSCLAEFDNFKLWKMNRKMTENNDRMLPTDLSIDKTSNSWSTTNTKNELSMKIRLKKYCLTKSRCTEQYCIEYP